MLLIPFVCFTDPVVPSSPAYTLSCTGNECLSDGPIQGDHTKHHKKQTHVSLSLCLKRVPLSNLLLFSLFSDDFKNSARTLIGSLLASFICMLICILLWRRPHHNHVMRILGGSCSIRDGVRLSEIQTVAYGLFIFAWMTCEGTWYIIVYWRSHNTPIYEFPLVWVSFIDQRLQQSFYIICQCGTIYVCVWMPLFCFYFVLLVILCWHLSDGKYMCSMENKYYWDIPGILYQCYKAHTYRWRFVPRLLEANFVCHSL